MGYRVVRCWAGAGARGAGRWLVVDVVMGRAGRRAYQIRAYVLRAAHQLDGPLPSGNSSWPGGKRRAEVTVGTIRKASKFLGGGLRDPGNPPHGSGAVGSTSRKGWRCRDPSPLLRAHRRAEVRAVLPGDKDYTAKGSHLEAGSLAAPSLSLLAFPAPDGFTVVEASWTALTSAPKALTLLVKARKEKRPWF